MAASPRASNLAEWPRALWRYHLPRVGSCWPGFDSPTSWSVLIKCRWSNWLSNLGNSIKHYFLLQIGQVCRPKQCNIIYPPPHTITAVIDICNLIKSYSQCFGFWHPKNYVSEKIPLYLFFLFFHFLKGTSWESDRSIWWRLTRCCSKNALRELL